MAPRLAKCESPSHDLQTYFWKSTITGLAPLLGRYRSSVERGESSFDAGQSGEAHDEDEATIWQEWTATDQRDMVANE
jgi:hypothetical protein